MAYCTYEKYTALGGSLSEDAFDIWAERASRLIDRLTLGRAAQNAKNVKDELADACARIVDMLAAQDRVQANSAYGALSSASTDGYSESYAAGAGQGPSAASSAACAILGDSLGDDRYGLLWQGV